MPVDQDTIKFHLERAANCGNVSALYTLAHIYLQLPHNDFQAISVEVCAVCWLYASIKTLYNVQEWASVYHIVYIVQTSPEHEAVGMEHLLGAAKRGLREAMFELAKALDSGLYGQ